MVVLIAGGEKRSPIAHASLHREAEDVAVEGDRPIEVRHLQVNVADVHPGIQGRRRGQAGHPQIVPDYWSSVASACGSA
jgi:hypothetical protein